LTMLSTMSACMNLTLYQFWLDNLNSMLSIHWDRRPIATLHQSKHYGHQNGNQVRVNFYTYHILKYAYWLLSFTRKDKHEVAHRKSLLVLPVIYFD
jgi:hypothetical protein